MKISSHRQWFANYFALVAMFSQFAGASEFWVSPIATNNGNGSREHPFTALDTALTKIRALRQLDKNNLAEPVQIILQGGIYVLSRPLILKPHDSGTKIGSLIIRAAAGEQPILSGGVQIKGWQQIHDNISGLPASAVGKIWKADVPPIDGRIIKFRQLWVNDRKANRAREPNLEYLNRLVAWDKKNQVATIPMAAMLDIKNPAQLEMLIDQVWEIAVLRVKTIRFQGTNALLTFKQPESKIEFAHPWPPVLMTANYHAPFFLANAIEFLDAPGEWFEDLSAGKIYYWPHDDEDMKGANVYAPVLETLVQMEGLPAQPVENVQFQGITFAHTTWLRPTEQGHVPLQAGMFMLDASKLSPKGTPYHRGLDNLAWIGRPPAALTLQNVSHISFENCTFEHLASAGLDFVTGTHDNLVRGCDFYDIGGNGIQLGKFSDAKIETHIPYQPSSEREICTRETISNNLIHNCGNEDWGCIGIAIGYAQKIVVEHNEVFNLPYTGISLGWGWTKTPNALRDNLILANHIHHVGQRLGDLGGIYTLSAQPGTVIAENYISDLKPSPFVPDPLHWFYIYLDEGSSGITVRENWCPEEKFLKNANGPGNVWTNNGPQVSDKIKNAAGLEPAFQKLLKLHRSKAP